MEPKTYEFLSTPGVPRTGVMAQDVQKIAPHLVETVSGHLGVNYIDMTAYLVGAVRAQQNQIANLQSALKVGL
jgi:hypothetical protein